jgi:hypothetical protein
MHFGSENVIRVGSLGRLTGIYNWALNTCFLGITTTKQKEISGSKLSPLFKAQSTCLATRIMPKVDIINISVVYVPIE